MIEEARSDLLSGKPESGQKRLYKQSFRNTATPGCGSSSSNKSGLFYSTEGLSLVGRRTVKAMATDPSIG